MKQKIIPGIKTTFSWLVILGLTTILITACEKVDDTYRNYTPTSGEFKGTSLQYLQSQAGLYDSMLLAIGRIEGLEDTLSIKPVTLFAVNNRSFSLALQNINQARADSIPSMPPVSISTIDEAVLDSFLCRYIVRDVIYSEDLMRSSDGIFVPTIKYNYEMQMQLTGTNASGYLGGGPLAIIFSYPPNDDKQIFTRYWIRVNTNTVDIESTNGLINLLPPGHDFGFGSDFVRAVNRR